MIIFHSVITGVRFERSNNVIFLNIQIGQLMSMGFVDETTVQWKKVPDDIESQYIEFGYHMRKFSTDIVNFKSLILTGIQFVKLNNSVRLRGFAKKVDNFYTGALLDRVETFTNNYKLREVSLQGKKPARNDQKSSYRRYYENYTIEFGMSDEKGNLIFEFVDQESY